MKEPGIDELEGKGVLVNSKSIGTRYEVITIMDVTLTQGLFSGLPASASRNFAPGFFPLTICIEWQYIG